MDPYIPLKKLVWWFFRKLWSCRWENRDEGIDGIIKEGKLGFSLIYIQAKRWNLNQSVGSYYFSPSQIS
ncbi:restriction endonuclease [Candidatus Desulfosporosinus nitrosoreducens]|uniref:restriction endonuclease n=1 Tax=Candidatus Desulfosporosinus nitrosoreducens TaxID=3401928 RepID=UPI0035AC0BA6